MKKFALYHPFSGKYVSNLVYDRKTKQYSFQLTYDMYKIRYWNSRSSAEAQAQRLFAWNRNVGLEVKEIR